MAENVLFEEFETLYFFHGSSNNWFMSNFHFHSQHEILLVLGGGDTLEVRDRKYDMENGDLFLLGCGEYHRTTGAKNKPYERYVLQFDPECFAEASAALKYNFTALFDNRGTNFIHKIHLSDANLERCMDFFKRMEHGVAGNGAGAYSSVKLKLSIMELLVFVGDIHTLPEIKKTESPRPYENSRVEFGRAATQVDYIGKIKKYIRDNIEKNLYLDIISDKFSMSRYHLSHCFKKETGFTLAQYITKEKIAKAGELLDAGYSVTDVSRMLSYSSDTHFISVFKKNCGITPKRYAKARNSNNI